MEEEEKEGSIKIIEDIKDILANDVKCYISDDKAIMLKELPIGDMDLVIKLSSQMPKNLREKIKKNIELNEEELQQKEEWEESLVRDKGNTIIELVDRALSRTFPESVRKDRDLISFEYFTPIAKKIMEMTNLSKQGDNKDFRKPQMKQ